MPEIIHQVAVEMVSELYEESPHKRNRLGVQSEGKGMNGVTSTTTFYQLTPRHEKLLSPYRVYLI
jgi:hypothetical protein